MNAHPEKISEKTGHEKNEDSLKQNAAKKMTGDKHAAMPTTLDSRKDRVKLPQKKKKEDTY